MNEHDEFEYEYKHEPNVLVQMFTTLFCLYEMTVKQNEESRKREGPLRLRMRLCETERGELAIVCVR